MTSHRASVSQSGISSSLEAVDRHTRQGSITEDQIAFGIRWSLHRRISPSSHPAAHRAGRTMEDTAEIVWTEQGGPEVRAPSASDGYGGQLLQRTVAAHLGGSISYEWTKSGVQVTL